MEEYHTLNVGVASSNLVTSTRIIFKEVKRNAKSIEPKRTKIWETYCNQKAKSKMEKLIGYVDAIVGVRNNLNLVNLG